jgi:hypothetical protein
MPAAKTYVVLVEFDRIDHETGKSTKYKPGDSYSGDDVEAYLDGTAYGSQGPLIAEKSDAAPPATPKEK